MPSLSHYFFSYIIIVSLILYVRSSTEIVILCEKLANVYCDRNVKVHCKQLDSNDYIVHKNISLEAGRVLEFRRNCNLPYLPRKFLEKFVYALEIYMNDRGVHSIKGEDFRGNRDLKKLVVTHNKLAQLPAYLFNNTPKIEEVDFSDNQIEEINPNTFANGVKRLKKIDLSWNRIKTFDGRLFRNAISLGNINFKFNQIEYFGFKLVKSTKKLNLSSYKNVSLNCMILPYKSKKRIFINVYQLIENRNRTLHKLEEIEVNCDSDEHFFYSNNYELLDDFLNVDGVKLEIIH